MEVPSTNIARIIGVFVSFAVTYASEHAGVTLDPATLTFIALSVYALVHRLISKKTNPPDAATSTARRQLTREFKVE